MNKLLRYSFSLVLMLCAIMVSASWKAFATSDAGKAAAGWTFASVTPAQGVVESLSKFSFTYPEGIAWVNESANLKITGPNGKVATVNLMDNFSGACEGTVLDEVLTAPGSYTLVIPAGTFTGGENLACGEMTYTWTIGGDAEGGDQGGQTPGDVTGKQWQEKIFVQGTKVDIPLNIDTEGVTLTSVGREFMGTTLDVIYNMYEEGELDWRNGTKLVFTAKDNITGIVIDGQFKEFASADKGSYVNGMWTGTLTAGQTLTLTANEGINVHGITILYNGAVLETEDIQEEEGSISVSWPVQNQVIASISQGGTLCKFTTNKDYAIVTIALKNDNPFYASHDLQTRMYDGKIIGEGVAKDIEHVVTTAVPNEKSFQLFKGDSYTLVLKAFVNQWDVQTDLYDAITEIPIMGGGVEHEKLSAVKLVSMTPAGTPIEPGVLPIAGGKITLTFDGAVTSVTAVNARGMEGSTTYKGTKADEEGKVWEVTLGDLSSLASAETEVIVFNLNITAKAADGIVIFDETKDDYRLEAAWLLVEPESEADLATLTIGGETIVLSETEAYAMAVYPAGAVIAINNDDDAIKKVTYEVIDLTANEILKSQGDLTKNAEGVWTATMPLDYKLAKGHDYSVHVKAFNGPSSFTSKLLYEYNFLLTGMANVKEYSTIKFLGVTPNDNETLADEEPVLTYTFDGPVAKLTAAVNVAQMDTRNIPAANITCNEERTVWEVKVPSSIMLDAAVAGTLSMHVTATDKAGNYVYDKDNSVGTPDKSYISFSWLVTMALPTPKLAETEVEVLEKLTFMYDGIGLNQDQSTATWKNIVILKDGAALNIALTEDMFEVLGEDAGNALVLTLPEPLYKGEYTIQVPAQAFMLGHDQANNYNGDCQFTVTVTKEAEGGDTPAEPVIELNITKTDWSQIGSDSGEIIGTVELKNATAFDHIEAEIRCQEDPDQYISFSNMMTNGGNLKCYCWEGGHYTLNKGYHYTLIVSAFDVPYYGAQPVAVATYEFVGTGAEVAKYSDIEVVKIDLPQNDLLYHGYDLAVASFDVTFSAPVSKVKVWAAMGMDGSVNYSAKKNSEDGTVWTIVLGEDVLGEEGSINLMIQAWDADGVQAKGWNGDHAFDYNLIISNSTPDDADAIKAIEMAFVGKTIYTLTGMRVHPAQMKKGQVYIVDGKKLLVK